MTPSAHFDYATAILTKVKSNTCLNNLSDFSPNLLFQEVPNFMANVTIATDDSSEITHM